MYFKQAFIASMAVLFPAALADSITCQTTSGSPVLSDVTDCINYFNGESGTFAPDPFASSGCTTYGKVEGAAVAICGSSSYTGPEIGGHALDIQNKCLNDGRVGGYVDLGGGNKIEVIHS